MNVLRLRLPVCRCPEAFLQMLRFGSAFFLISAIVLAQQPETLAAHLSRAQQLLAQHKPELAVQEYEAAVLLDSNNLEAQSNLGVLLYFQNDCPRAIEHLNRALQLQPSSSRTQALLGICQKRQGQFAEAGHNLEAALPSIKEEKITALIQKNLVELYYAEGDLALASNTVESLLKNEPHDPDVLYMFYRIHADLADRARSALAVLAPDSGRMHQMEAEHFVNLGDAANAIVQYERALARDPQLPGVRFELAEAILEDSRSSAALERATTLLQEALKENPRNAGAEAKLGYIAVLRNHPEEAEGEFAKALAIQPDQLDALKGMADLSTQRGDSEKALGYLLDASKADPLDDTLHYRISRLYRTLNQKEKSDREMDVYLKLRDLKKKTALTEQRVAPN